MLHRERLLNKSSQTSLRLSPKDCRGCQPSNTCAGLLREGRRRPSIIERAGVGRAGGPLLVESIALERIAHFQSWGGPCSPGLANAGPLNVQTFPYRLWRWSGPHLKNREIRATPGIAFYSDVDYLLLMSIIPCRAYQEIPGYLSCAGCQMCRISSASSLTW